MAAPVDRTDLTTRFDDADIGTDLDAWLAKSEARFADIRPGLQKRIVWADPDIKGRTPLVIVSIHGFSASSQEVRPLPDIVAKALGANIFYTRLAGHGRSSDAMGEPALKDWMRDMAEALAIGKRLGDHVVVIASSSGATLATLALSEPEMAKDIVAVVFLSPNFALKATGSSLLTAPFAATIARLILGPRRAFTPLNALHASGWTTDYPVTALLPMARMVQIARSVSMKDITVPALFLVSPQDQVVDSTVTAGIASAWGGKAEMVDPEPVGDPFHHVIAGDALSPGSTDRLSQIIVDWLKRTL